MPLSPPTGPTVRPPATLAPVLLAALLCALALPAAHAAGAGRIVLVSKCGGLGVQRPAQIVFSCADAALLVQHARWSRWGGRVAVGHGEMRENLCDPFCAAGNFRITPVTVHLFKRHVCPGRIRLYYRDGTLIDGGDRRTAVRISCPY